MTVRSLGVRGAYPRDWVYECGVCQTRKRFPDKRLRRPVCHQKLMELVSNPYEETTR